MLMVTNGNIFLFCNKYSTCKEYYTYLPRVVYVLSSSYVLMKPVVDTSRQAYCKHLNRSGMKSRPNNYIDGLSQDRQGKMALNLLGPSMQEIIVGVLSLWVALWVDIL